MGAFIFEGHPSCLGALRRKSRKKTPAEEGENGVDRGDRRPEAKIARNFLARNGGQLRKFRQDVLGARGSEGKRSKIFVKRHD